MILSEYTQRLEVYLLPALVVLAVLVSGVVAFILINRYLYEVRLSRLDEEWSRLQSALRRAETEPEGNVLDRFETGEGRGTPRQKLEAAFNKAGRPNRAALIRDVKEMDEPERSKHLEDFSRGEDLDSVSRQALRGLSKWSRIQAIELLGEFEDQEALGVLERCLRDRDQDVVYFAIRTLSGLEEERAAGILLGLLGTGRIDHKLLVAMLEEFPLPIDELIWEKLESENPEVRVWAATLLEVSEREGSVERLLEFARDDDPDVRSASIRSLANIGNPRGKEALPAALEDESWFVRAGAARTAGSLGAPELSERLLQLLQDENWWVRQNSKTALVELCPEVEESVIEHLSSEDRFARNMVVEVLEGCGAVERKARELERDPDSEQTLRFFELLVAAEGQGAVESAAHNVAPEARRSLERVLEPLELAESAGNGS